MEKRHYKWATVLIAVVIAITQLLPIVSAAEKSSVEPLYVGIISMAPKVEIDSTGRAKCSDIVRLKGGYSAAVTWKLQYLNGTTWNTKMTWTASGKSVINLDKGYIIASKGKYRLYATYVVYNSSGRVVETPARASVSVEY